MRGRQNVDGLWYPGAPRARRARRARPPLPSPKDARARALADRARADRPAPDQLTRRCSAASTRPGRRAIAPRIVLKDAALSTHDYTLAEVRAIHDLPLPELMLRAQTVHREHHPADEVQLCSLLSVKTGGCPEDCAYCPQSSHYDTGLERRADDERRPRCWTPRRARKAAGATRFCMGAAWREVKDGPAFDEVLDMVRGVRELGMEACVHARHAERGAGAARWPRRGCRAYNHNLDTSREFYGSIITHAHVRRSPAHAGATCARPASPSARAASSAWANRIGRPLRDADDAGEPRPAARERADQRAGPGRGDAAGRRSRRSIRSSWCA